MGFSFKKTDKEPERGDAAMSETTKVEFASLRFVAQVFAC